MAISTIFSLSNLSSLPVTLFLHLVLLVTSLMSTLASHVSLLPTQFASTWTAILNQALFGHRLRSFPTHHEVGVVGFDGSEPVQCVVCLCEIEKGEEVTELKCQHKFHGVCLRQWMDERHLTCPLCRGFVGPTYDDTTGYDEEVEAVYFRRFSLVGSGEDSERDTWWLR